MGEYRRHDVGRRHHHPDAHEEILDAAERSLADERDHGESGDEGADGCRHAEERQRRADAGELGHDRAKVRGNHRSEEHTSELQSPYELVCRLLLEKNKLDREKLGRPQVYGSDRLFVHLRLESDKEDAEPSTQLDENWQTVVTISVRDVYELGHELF